MRLMDDNSGDVKLGRSFSYSSYDDEDEDLSLELEQGTYSLSTSSNHHTSNDVEDCFTMSESPVSDFISNVLNHVYERNIIYDTQQLYIRFLRNQIHSHQLPIPDVLQNFRTFRSDIRRHVHTLHVLAKKFSQMPQRKDLQGFAQRVDLDTLNYENFEALLKGLFEKGGLTYERVIVLFFFCSDLSIRVLKEKLIFNYFLNLVNWTLRYIQDHLCRWVELHGGWNQILPQLDNDFVVRFTQFTLISMFCIGIVAIIFYYRNKSGNK